jgi:hypothetical protein
MPLWGKKPVKGISDTELKEHGNRLANRLHSAFDGHSKNIRDQKRAILDSALGLTLDRDTNMSSGQKHGVVQSDEFEAVVGGLEKKGVFSKDEAARLRNAARDALND